MAATPVGLRVARRRVEQPALHGRPHERARLVLRDDADQPLACRLQRRARGAAAHDQRPAAAVGRHAPRHDQPVLVVGHELAQPANASSSSAPGGSEKDASTYASAADGPTSAASPRAAQHQPQRLGQHRLAGAGLARHHVEARRQIQLGALDQDEVRYEQTFDHEAKASVPVGRRVHRPAATLA